MRSYIMIRTYSTYPILQYLTRVRVTTVLTVRVTFCFVLEYVVARRYRTNVRVWYWLRSCRYGTYILVAHQQSAYYSTIVYVLTDCTSCLLRHKSLARTK